MPMDTALFLRALLPHVEVTEVVSELFIDAEFDAPTELSTSIDPQPDKAVKAQGYGAAVTEARNVQDPQRLTKLARHSSLQVRRAVGRNPNTPPEVADYLATWAVKKDDTDTVNALIAGQPCAYAWQLIDEVSGFGRRVATDEWAERLLDAGTRQDILRGRALDGLHLELARAYVARSTDRNTPTVSLTELVSDLPCDADGPTPTAEGIGATVATSRSLAWDVTDATTALCSLAAQFGSGLLSLVAPRRSYYSHRALSVGETVLREILAAPDEQAPEWLKLHVVAHAHFKRYASLPDELQARAVTLLTDGTVPDDAPAALETNAGISVIDAVQELRDRDLRLQISRLVAEQQEFVSHLSARLFGKYPTDAYQLLIEDPEFLRPIFGQLRFLPSYTTLMHALRDVTLPSEIAPLVAQQLAALDPKQRLQMVYTLGSLSDQGLLAVMETFGQHLPRLVESSAIAQTLAARLATEFGTDVERWRTFTSVLDSWEGPTSDLIDTVHTLHGGRPAPAAAEDEQPEPEPEADPEPEPGPELEVHPEPGDEPGPAVEGELPEPEVEPSRQVEASPVEARTDGTALDDDDLAPEDAAEHAPAAAALPEPPQQLALL